MLKLIHNSQLYLGLVSNVCNVCVCSLTLVEANDVGVPERGRDLDLSLDVDLVQVVSDALLADRLDRHLREKHSEYEVRTSESQS